MISPPGQVLTLKYVSFVGRESYVFIDIVSKYHRIQYNNNINAVNHDQIRIISISIYTNVNYFLSFGNLQSSLVTLKYTIGCHIVSILGYGVLE